MANLEYSESISESDRKVHNCKKCPYVTKSYFYMVYHEKRHHSPLKSSSCERNDLKKYYCKECNFETDLVKKNVGTYIQGGTNASVVPSKQERQEFWKNTKAQGTHLHLTKTKDFVVPIDETEGHSCSIVSV
ncbi:hypothetical protein MTP99_010332 [Tenebrio molitor]|nr:hypothetical protein MTP99_010332 [Tenebrio molitor]